MLGTKEQEQFLQDMDQKINTYARQIQQMQTALDELENLISKIMSRVMEFYPEDSELQSFLHSAIESLKKQ